MRERKIGRQARIATRALDRINADEAFREAARRHNGVDDREICRTCNEPIEPKDMVIGDFRTDHSWCVIDTTIAHIENDDPVARDAFRNAELGGALAPHVFVENSTNAVCQDCGMVIQFT